jgi:hypothetical protein
MTSLTRILDQSSKLRQAVPIARLLRTEQFLFLTNRPFRSSSVCVVSPVQRIDACRLHLFSASDLVVFHDAARAKYGAPCREGTGNIASCP